MNDPKRAPRAPLSSVIAAYGDADLIAKRYASGDVELYEVLAAPVRRTFERQRHVATRNKGSRWWWVLLRGRWHIAKTVPMFDKVADPDDTRGEAAR